MSRKNIFIALGSFVGLTLVIVGLTGLYYSYREFQILSEYAERIAEYQILLDRSVEQQEEILAQVSDYLQEECRSLSANPDRFSRDGYTSLQVGILRTCKEVLPDSEFQDLVINILDFVDGGLLKLGGSVAYKVNLGEQDVLATKTTERKEFSDGTVYYSTDYILSDDLVIMGIRTLTFVGCESPLVAGQNELVIKVCEEEK